MFYLTAVFCDFFSPYPPDQLIGDAGHHPPSRIRLFHEKRLVRPFVYGIASEVDQEAFIRVFTEDRSVRYPLRFFTTGAEYRLLGLFPSRVRLFGVEAPGAVFLFGSDKLSRDLFSRRPCPAATGSTATMSVRSGDQWQRNPASHRERRDARLARRDEPAYQGICARGATQPAGIDRRSNAAGVAPRAAYASMSLKAPGGTGTGRPSSHCHISVRSSHSL